MTSAEVKIFAMSPLLAEIAGAHPELGYRRVWAKAKAKGYNKSKSTAYLEMKKRRAYFAPDIIP